MSLPVSQESDHDASTSSERVVEVVDAKRHYRLKGETVRALDGISLSISPGELLAIAGPSGSGKTTLLNLIGALDRPTEGDVLVDGKRLSALSRRELSLLRRDHIGFIFQDHNLVPVMSVKENVEYVLLLQGVDRKTRNERVAQVLADVGLGELASRRPSELSGGQQQRVAVARAIVGRPSIVLADEPTANLDSATGAALLDMMVDLNQKHRTTFVFSTHDPMVMERATRLIRLRDGQSQSSTPEDTVRREKDNS